MLRATTETLSAVHEFAFAGPKSGILALAGTTIEYVASHADKADTLANAFAPFVRLLGMGTVVLVFLWQSARFLLWARRKVLQALAPDCSSGDHRPEPCRRCGVLGEEFKVVRIRPCRERDEDDTDEDSKP